MAGTYEGVCQGGPWDRQQRVHDQRTFELIGLGDIFVREGRPDDPLPTRHIGTYRWSSAGRGYWVWEPADA